MTRLTTEQAFRRLYENDDDFHSMADVAKSNGWPEAAIVREYLLDLHAEAEEDHG